MRWNGTVGLQFSPIGVATSERKRQSASDCWPLKAVTRSETEATHEYDRGRLASNPSEIPLHVEKDVLLKVSNTFYCLVPFFPRSPVSPYCLRSPLGSAPQARASGLWCDRRPACWIVPERRQAAGLLKASLWLHSCHYPECAISEFFQEITP